MRGMALFAGLGCRMCHRDPTFSAAGTIKPSGVYKPFPVFPDNEYVRKYDLPYLKEQYYLKPHPIELQLRNHA